MDQKIIDLFDEYTHKPLSREDFLRRLIQLTGSTTAAMTVLPLLEINYAKAQTISDQDDTITTRRVSYSTPTGEMKGLLAMPAGSVKCGAVVVIHENRGLNPHTEDVARRVAKAGFIGLAPDALSEFGGTPNDADQARELIGRLDLRKTIERFASAFTFLRDLPESNGKTGCVGFCWGGAMANNLAVNVANLQAAVAFYGRQPEAAEVPKINAALQLHYAGLDDRINTGIKAYEDALKSAGKNFELYMYEGAQHAFYNDSAPTRYNEEAAKLAWQRTLDFFKKYLA